MSYQAAGRRLRIARMRRTSPSPNRTQLCPLETYGEPLCLSSIPFWKRLVKTKFARQTGNLIVCLEASKKLALASTDELLRQRYCEYDRGTIRPEDSPPEPRPARPES